MYFLKRIAFIVPLLLLISFLAFLLLKLAPGGPFDQERAPASEAIRKNIEAKYHLNEPTWKQYLRYLGLMWERDVASGELQRVNGGLIVGDFGPSYKYRDHSVNDIIAQALPVSLTLGLLAFVFVQCVGIPLGFYTAVRRGQLGDHVGSFFAVLVVCIPALVVAPVLITLFAIKWQWFPPALWGTPWHVVLPVVALGLFFAGKVARLMREGLLNTLQSEFITTARAKGLSEAKILWKHAFRLAVLPVVSYSGPLLADLLTGSFVVEAAFQIPGIGVFMVNSMLNRDYPMTVGLVILYAVLLLVLNLVVDFSYSLLDPRVRYD
ncbi:MAG TPA: ABC transporter permease [Methylomirabilota bacterium]|nr:ABC transporter permease [Methylomirabilota bacterium]